MNDVDNQIKSFNDIADLQDELLNDDGEITFQDCLQNLLSSPLLNNPRTFRSVLVSIYICYLCRPCPTIDYIDLFIQIAKHPNNVFKSDDYLFSFSNKFFIYKLYQAGLVTISSIYDHSIRSDTFGNYFYPELLENYPNEPNFKNQSSLRVITTSVKASGYEIDDTNTQSIINKFIELRSKGQNPDPIALSIRNDDIDRLQQLLSQTNTPANSHVNYSIFERFIFVNEQSTELSPTLIEYAAFFGSLQCFKFLYQKIAQIPPRLCHFSVAGGNYEIIHLCEQSEVTFDNDCLKLSIRFFHPELTRYLEDNFDLKKTIEEVSKSIVSYNLRSLIDCTSVLREDPNQIDSCGNTALAIACINGDLDIVQYLITKFAEKIDLNAQNSCEYATFTVLEISTKTNLTALHLAASRGHIGIVKYLCALPGIDINADCGINYHPIDCAVENCHVEIVEFLSGLNGIVIFKRNELRTSILEAALFSKRLDIMKLVVRLVMESLHEENIDDFVKNDEMFRFHLGICSSLASVIGLDDMDEFISGILKKKEKDSLVKCSQNAE